MGQKDERGKALFANVERGVRIFCKVAIVSFISVRYISNDLYCRMAGTPSSTTLFFYKSRVEIEIETTTTNVLARMLQWIQSSRIILVHGLEI